MNALIAGLGLVSGVLRTALFAVGVVAATLAALSYLVRTRRLNPFSPVSRFVRGSIDPLFAPVERRVLAAGGRPASAPWWALVAVAVIGIIVLSLFDFLVGQLGAILVATQTGGLGLVWLAVTWTFGLLQLALIVRVLSSWIPAFRYSRPVLWSFALTEWLLRPLRRVVPTIGMIDITPIVAYFVLGLLEGGVKSLLR